MEDYLKFKEQVVKLSQKIAKEGNFRLNRQEVFSKTGIKLGFENPLNAWQATSSSEMFNEKCLDNFIDSNFQQEDGTYNAILASSILQIVFITALKRRLPSNVIKEFRNCLLKNKEHHSPEDNFTDWLKKHGHLQKLKDIGIVHQSLEEETFKGLLENLENCMESEI